MGGSNRECPYAEIAEKLKKISWINKAWCTRMSDTRRITLQCDPHKNLGIDEICEEMA